MWNQPTSEFEVFLFRRRGFRESAPLPHGFSFELDPAHEAERRLLEAEYPQWQTPLGRQFPGGDKTSVVGVRHQEDLVGVIYLSPENEFDLPGFGQIHYPVVDPAFRGNGIYAPLLTSLLRIAEREHLEGLILVSDREGMADIYRRWGAELVGAYSRAGRVRRRLNRLVDPHRQIRARIIAGVDSDTGSS